MQQWHALRILSNSEKGIAKDLADLKVPDCECYYPKKVVWRKVYGARRKKIGASREKLEVALFKGYLFLKIDLDLTGTEFWRRLRNVFGWVAVNGKPLAIVGNQIDRLKAAEECGDNDETQKILRDLRALVGCAFYINDGLLEGYKVIVNSADENDISVSVANSDMKAKLPVDFFVKNSHKLQLDDRELNSVR